MSGFGAFIASSGLRWNRRCAFHPRTRSAIRCRVCQSLSFHQSSRMSAAGIVAYPQCRSLVGDFVQCTHISASSGSSSMYSWMRAWACNSASGSWRVMACRMCASNSGSTCCAKGRAQAGGSMRVMRNAVMAEPGRKPVPSVGMGGPAQGDKNKRRPAGAERRWPLVGLVQGGQSLRTQGEVREAQSNRVCIACRLKHGGRRLILFKICAALCCADSSARCARWLQLYSVRAMISFMISSLPP